MMKKLNLMTRIMGLALVLLIGHTSCSNLKKENEEKKSTNTLTKKSEKPSMDIHAAVFMSNKKALQQHIEQGLDLNSKDAYGSTPLNIAATFGKTDVAILLIEGGADINVTNADGSTPLHTSAFFGRPEIVKALLKKGVDKTIRNQYGSTALESVSVPFEDVKPIYLQIAKDLGPLGLRLDLDIIESTRPTIAKMIAE